MANSGADASEIRPIAMLLGDRPDGAEAWDAVGEVSDDDRLAIDAYVRALAHRDVDDLRGRARDAVGLLHRYAARDELRPAMGYAGLAYKLSTRLQDRDLSSYVLASVAGLLFDMGAVPVAEALVAEEDRVIGESSPFFPSLCQLHGLISLSHGRYELARQQLVKTIVLAERAGLRQLARNAKLTIVAIDIDQGNLDDAHRVEMSDVITAADDQDDRTHHAYLAARVAFARGDDDEALGLIASAFPSASFAWKGTLEALRGAVLVHAKRNAEAEQSLLSAIRSSEKRRADLDLDEMKPWLLQREWRWPFEDLFVLYVSEGRLLDAFDVAQQATARSVLDGLLTRDVETSSSVERRLVEAGDHLEGLRALTQSLRSSTAVQPPNATDVVKALGGRHVLTYFRARDDIWLITSRSSLTISDLGPARELSALSAKLRSDPSDRVVAAILANRLIPRSQLPPVGVPVYLVTDEAIADAPFAALRIDDEPLVVRNPIAYEPSAAVLAQISSAVLPEGKPIVLGDPTGDLPNARSEAEEVAKSVGVTAFVESLATSWRITGATHLGLLHVAAHAKKSSGGATLVLADRDVTSGDIIDAGLKVATVVLTSCESADVSSSELGPLALAFLAGGAHAVVASRWSVDDAVAWRFSRAFYANDGARDPIEATALAQRELIRSGTSASSWATFVVYGEGARDLKGKSK